MGIGRRKLQNEVLKVIAEQGKWTWAGNLVVLVAMPAPGVIIPYAFYVSVLRAANSLVRKNELCSGFPDHAEYGVENWRTAFWMPGQIAPKIARAFPAALIETKVLQEIFAASEPLRFADLLCRLETQLKIDRYELHRLKMPVHRAITKLLNDGEIQALTVAGKRCLIAKSGSAQAITAA